MQEIEAGRMGLDAPVNLHLPADQQIPDQGQSEPIRIRHLMAHSPGFEERAFGEIFIRDPARLRAPGATVRERRPDRVRAPGVLSSYSNYGVLGPAPSSNKSPAGRGPTSSTCGSSPRCS